VKSYLDLRAVVAFVVLCGSWGLAQVATKVTLYGFPPAMQMGARSLIAAVLVFLWCIVRGKPVFGVICGYVGPVEAGERAFAPLLEWDPAVAMVGPMPYTALQQLIAAGNPPGRRQYWKAGFLPELTDDAIETFVGHAGEVCSPFTANIMLPMGGAIARVAEGETPLRYRDAKWNYHVLSQWDDAADDQRNIEWTRAFDQAMAAYAHEGVFVNFVAEPGENLIRHSFGEESYSRLVAVKDEYDPGNVFNSNMNIAPSGAVREGAGLAERG